jgi:anti-sigma B factor antagonist
MSAHPASELVLTVRRGGGAVVLRPAGKLRALEAEFILQQARARIRGGCRALIFELDEVTLMSSSALGMLGVCCREMRECDGRIAVVRPAAEVRELLEIARLTDRLPAYDSVAAAAQAVGVPDGPWQETTVRPGGGVA